MTPVLPAPVIPREPAFAGIVHHVSKDIGLESIIGGPKPLVDLWHALLAYLRISLFQTLPILGVFGFESGITWVRRRR